MGLLEGQARMQVPSDSCATSCTTSEVEPYAAPLVTPVSIGPGTMSISENPTLSQRFRLPEFGKEFVTVGRRLVIFFLGFTTISYAAIELVPTAWITDYVGADSFWSVPIGALLGLPAYLNSEASLPMVAGLMDGGMGPGAAMAFIVTGAGTSIGAITGLLLIARSRIVGLAVGMLFVGALALGTVAHLVL